MEMGQYRLYDKSERCGLLLWGSRPCFVCLFVCLVLLKGGGGILFACLFCVALFVEQCTCMYTMVYPLFKFHFASTETVHGKPSGNPYLAWNVRCWKFFFLISGNFVQFCFRWYIWISEREKSPSAECKIITVIVSSSQFSSMWYLSIQESLQVHRM